MIKEFYCVSSDLDLKYFVKRLEERLKSIISGQKKEDVGSVELDQARVGRLTRMDAMQQQAMSKAAARLADLERQRILAALDRVKNGSYGYCVICEDEIAQGRLKFDPSVLTCISCARDADETGT